MNNSVLELKNVSKIYSIGLFKKVKKLALDEINLSIKKGEKIAIIGESGMGKSTLAKIMCDLETPSKGEVYWFGENLRKMNSKEYRKMRIKVQYVHQDPYASLHPSKDIFSILKDPILFNRICERHEVKEKVEELLELVGLTPTNYFLNKYPHHLSGGGRQRLAIARALSVNPEILVADEPISMIDMSLRASIIKLLKDINSKLNISIVLILHDIGAAKYFAEGDGKLVVIYGGRIVEYGSCDEIINNPKHPYTRVLISSTAVPDPELSKRKIVEELKSYEPPKRMPESKECPFVHACNYAKDICLNGPSLEKINDIHFVSCHRYKELPNWKLFN